MRTSPAPNAVLPDATGFRSVQRQRLRQILWILLAALSVATVMDLIRGEYGSIAVQAVIATALLCAYYWNATGHYRRAATTVTWAVLLGMGLVMVVDQGLYDESVLTFPGVLIFAAMFASRRQVLLLTCIAVLILFAAYLLDRTGVLPSVPAPMDLRRFIILALITAISGFFVWLITGDLRRALARLKADKIALTESRSRIEVLAHRDGLTGLPNRVIAQERLSYLLQQADEVGGKVAVLFLDIDNFKTINDSLGHLAGDGLLQQVGGALSECVRVTDMVARMSGDEFLVLLGGISGEEVIFDVLGKITERLGDTFELNAMDVHITASIGIAVAPRDGSSADELLKNADAAMYRAKEAGRNTSCFFDVSMNEAVIEHLQIASGLRTAQERGELQVHYQPQIDLRSGRIVGAEALLRWQHPVLGNVSPARFIPIAEHAGLIHALGEWVLRQACHDAVAWREAGFDGLVVSVNVSPLQFRRDQFIHVINAALQGSGLPANALELELTESVLADDARYLAETLQRLAEQGVQIAVDDFGTGYSNLGYLQRFSVQRLKVDQSFVRGVGSSLQDEGLIRAIIEMARCLGLRTVAEGVENEVAMERLRSFGCEFGQGFHWAPALPLNEFIEFVRTRQPA